MLLQSQLMMTIYARYDLSKTTIFDAILNHSQDVGCTCVKNVSKPFGCFKILSALFEPSPLALLLQPTWCLSTQNQRHL